MAYQIDRPGTVLLIDRRGRLVSRLKLSDCQLAQLIERALREPR